ncbi:MAG TPA: RNA chaperone Hfq [Acidobacteriota bacterium]
MQRRLIRPNLSEIKDKFKGEQIKKKMHPSYDTFAENYYYLKQMNKKTVVAVVFVDGEKVEGTIEWYDRNCIKLNRDVEPNLLVYKSNIKYLYKLEEGKEGGGPEPEKKE